MEYAALYRQWRPKTFEKVIGQEHIVRTLKNQVKGDRISHVYLFCGPRGTGKTSVARIFAHAVNCLSAVEGSPCGICAVCTGLYSGGMDIIEVDAASNNGVDEMRELRDRVKYPPVHGRYKVYIIDEVHMLSMGAFNALLKTLEEPPGHIIFILATTEPHKLPATILSRCQRFSFKRIPYTSIVRGLSEIAQSLGISIEQEAISTIARWAEGGMRDAISLMDQCVGFCGDKVTNEGVLSVLGAANEDAVISLVEHIVAKNTSQMLRQVAAMLDDGSDISVLLKDIINQLRNVMIVKICAEPEAMLDGIRERYADYQRQAQAVSLRQLTEVIEILSGIEAEMRWSTQPRVLLEIALIKACSPELGQSFTALAERVQNIENSLQRFSPSPEKTVAVQPLPENARAEKPAAPTKLQPNRSSTDNAHVAALSQTVVASWPAILRTVKAQREFIYSLLVDAQLRQGRSGEMVLVFAPEQGFNASMVEREENRRFVEDAIFKTTGRRFGLKCMVKDSPPLQAAGDVNEAVVQRVYEFFGKERVEVIDD